MALFGPRPLQKGIADEQWHLGGAAGHAIASGGPAEILAFLSRLKTFDDRDARDGPHNDWGILYSWLGENRDEDLKPLLDLARDHIQKNYPIAAGRLLFGRKITERVMHSVTSASVEFDLFPAVVRQQLGAAGVIENDPAKRDNHILFPAGPNARLLERLGRGISTKEAQRHINCDRQVFGPLADAGFLEPIVEVESGNSYFDPEDLDRFVHGLSANATPYTAKPPGLEAIATARMKAGCSHAEIVGLILEGQLRNLGRLETELGYAAILVDPIEVAGYTHGEDLGGMVPHHIPADLGIPYAAVMEMLEVHWPTETRIHPRRRCPQRVVDNEVYSRFKSRYVSLRDLAREAQVHPKRHLADLRDRGFSPEPGFPKGAFLYLRERIG